MDNDYNEIATRIKNRRNKNNKQRKDKKITFKILNRLLGLLSLILAFLIYAYKDPDASLINSIFKTNINLSSVNAYMNKITKPLLSFLNHAPNVPLSFFSFYKYSFAEELQQLMALPFYLSIYKTIQKEKKDHKNEKRPKNFFGLAYLYIDLILVLTVLNLSFTILYVISKLFVASFNGIFQTICTIKSSRSSSVSTRNISSTHNISDIGYVSPYMIS